MSNPVLAARKITQTFRASAGLITPYENLSFEIRESQILAVCGKSGSGKTTVLLACGGMRAPTRGDITLCGEDLYRLSAAARVRFRSQKLGYLFQTLELLPYVSVLQNVKLAGRVRDDSARVWLDKLGLSARLDHKPFALSHGERQRVALARAMAHRPAVVICDEPTGNLDAENSQIVFGALRKFADDGGAVLIASHDTAVKSLADEVLYLGPPTGAAEPDAGAGSHHFDGRAAARSGSVSRLLLFLLGSVLAVVALGMAALQLRPEAVRSDNQLEKVRIYCAAGVAKPLQEIIETYNNAYQARVEMVRTGGSGELAGQISTEYEVGTRDGADLYLSADDFLLEQSHRRGVIAERLPVAAQHPVIAVKAGSSSEVDSLQALITLPGIKFGLASQRAAVGRIVRDIAAEEGILEELEKRKVTDAENVMMLAQAIVAGSLDAAVVWNTTVQQVNEREDKPLLQVAAHADRNNQRKSNIGIGVLSSTDSPTAALRFCRYLCGSSEAQEIFEKYGFEVVPGDSWEEVPELHLYCGSMFTPILEEEIREFARREGVNIYPRWQGCGKLVASIQSTEDPDLLPDAFLACDVAFVEMVQDFFQPHEMYSTNDIVIAVRPGAWSEKIKSPKDLLARGIRFGICDAQLSALGSLTRELLSQPPYEGMYPQIYERASVVADVGPTLISQVIAEGLDAAIVYRSNVLADAKAADLLQLVELESERARANQAWAIAKDTQNAQLMNRLHEWISRTKIRSRFEVFGFRDAQKAPQRP